MRLLYFVVVLAVQGDRVENNETCNRQGAPLSTSSKINDCSWHRNVLEDRFTEMVRHIVFVSPVLIELVLRTFSRVA